MAESLSYSQQSRAPVQLLPALGYSNLGKTEAEMDALFTLAASLTPN